MEPMGCCYDRDLFLNCSFVSEDFHEGRVPQNRSVAVGVGNAIMLEKLLGKSKPLNDILTSEVACCKFFPSDFNKEKPLKKVTFINCIFSCDHTKKI